MKKVFKIFFDGINAQENWLNSMATKGYHLVKTTRWFYYFEDSLPNQYEYKVEYVAHKSYEEMLKYKDFLNEVGITTFEKPINVGQYSCSRIKYRPFADKGGKFAKSKGMINKELLILEKKSDGEKFQVHTDIEDKIQYYKSIRKAYISIEIFLLALVLFQVIMRIALKKPWFLYEFIKLGGETPTIIKIIGSGIFVSILSYVTFRSISYTKLISNLKNHGSIYENWD